jgi:hypothetical protein
VLRVACGRGCGVQKKVVALQQKLGLDNQNTSRLRQHLAHLSRISKQVRRVRLSPYLAPEITLN